MLGNQFPARTLLGFSANRGTSLHLDCVVTRCHGRSKGKKVRVMRQILLILTLTALYGIVSGIWFVRGSLRPRRTSSISERRHGRRKVCEPGGEIEDNAEKTAEVAEEIEYCLTQVVEGQE